MIEEPRRLGRGLAALLGTSQSDMDIGVPQASQRRAPIEFLRPNSQNPRTEFDESELEDLTASIRQRGILQPIVVRASPTLADVYEIIAGERRWRAAQKAGLHEVPIVVLTASDKDALELAIIENVQRSDLNPLDEAVGYERLSQEYGYSQGEIAVAIGKSRSHVANMIRLTKLPDKSKSLLKEGKISSGHARALLAVAEPDSVAENIIQKGLTVRDVERLAQQEVNQPVAPSNLTKSKSKDPNGRALEKRLSEALGLTCTIKMSSDGSAGNISVKFSDLDQLDLVCERLCGK